MKWQRERTYKLFVCLEMVDLGLCGLLVSVFLFIAPSAIYLTYGWMCFGRTHRSYFCWNVTDETAAVLIVFGFVFLVFGTITCGFTFMVWRSTVKTNAKHKDDDEFKANLSEWV